MCVCDGGSAFAIAVFIHIQSGGITSVIVRWLLSSVFIVVFDISRKTFWKDLQLDEWLISVYKQDALYIAHLFHNLGAKISESGTCSRRGSQSIKSRLTPAIPLESSCTVLWDFRKTASALGISAGVPKWLLRFCQGIFKTINSVHARGSSVDDCLQ